MECYPLSGSIDEKKEHETLLNHLTFAMLGTSCIRTLLRIIYRQSRCVNVANLDLDLHCERVFRIHRIH
jgi:hypothetical protein